MQFVNFGNEPVANARNGLNELRMVRVITNRVANLLDAVCKRPICYHNAGPQVFKQFVLGDQAAVVFDKEDQRLERFGTKRYRLIRILQSVIAYVKGEITKPEHVPSGMGIYRHHQSFMSISWFRQDSLAGFSLFAGQAKGQTVTTIKEVTYHCARRRTIKRRRTGLPPLCAICGGDTELISVAAAARGAGVSPEKLCDWLGGFQGPANTSFQQRTLVCLACVSKCQNARVALNSTE